MFGTPQVKQTYFALNLLHPAANILANKVLGADPTLTCSKLHRLFAKLLMLRELDRVTCIGHAHFNSIHLRILKFDFLVTAKSICMNAGTH